MTATLAPPGRSDDQLVVLDEMSWDLYEHLLQDLVGRHIFVTYDRGRLEIMAPSFRHERSGELFGSFVRMPASELRMPFISGGSTTFRLKSAEAGLEPDRCFYVQNVDTIKGKRELDLTIDPPPDLAIEVEISRRLVNRLEVYRRLRVPEVWCYNGVRLRILRLTGEEYQESEHSGVFQMLKAADVSPLIEQSWTMDELEWDGFVREWVRQRMQLPGR